MSEFGDVLTRLIGLRERGVEWIGPACIDTSVTIEEVIKALTPKTNFLDAATQTHYPSDEGVLGRIIDKTDAWEERQDAGSGEAGTGDAPAVVGVSERVDDAGDGGTVVVRVDGADSGRPDGPEAVAEIPED